MFSSHILSILFDFDDTLSYVNDMLISISSEAEKSKSLLLEIQKRFVTKRSRVNNLELQLKNITLDRNIVRADKYVLMKLHNIYCNSVK